MSWQISPWCVVFKTMLQFAFGMRALTLVKLLLVTKVQQLFDQ
jgi:hypothetical protein